MTRVITATRSTHSIIETHETRFVFCKLVTCNLYLVFEHLTLHLLVIEEGGLFILSVKLLCRPGNLRAR